MNIVIAGWFAGYAMAILSTVALTYLAITSTGLAFMRRVLHEGVSPVLLVVPLSFGTTLVWTAIGLVLGSIYKIGGLEDGPPILGSPSGPFMIAMVGVAAVPLPVLLILAPRTWWLWLSMSGAFAGLFGWVMPLLATR